MLQLIRTTLSRHGPLAARKLLVVAGLPLLITSGCVTEPITGRHLPMGLSEAQLNQMGVEGYQQVLKESKISTNPGDIALVERVGRRIAAAADKRMQEAKPPRELYQWEFKVIDEPQTANAFALPGGKVAFYNGILPICGSEARVAVVMGHEVAHAYALHGGARVTRSVLTQTSLEVVMAALGGEQASTTSKTVLQALGVGYQLAGETAFSRGDESAADRIGLVLMAEAGYDPSEAVAFWERMEKMSGGGSPPEFLSTHPSHETRVEQIKGWLPQAQEAYRKAQAAGAP